MSAAEDTEVTRLADYFDEHGGPDLNDPKTLRVVRAVVEAQREMNKPRMTFRLGFSPWIIPQSTTSATWCV